MAQDGSNGNPSGGGRNGCNPTSKYRVYLGCEEADAGQDSREQGRNIQLSKRWVTPTTPGIMPRVVKVITAWLDG